MNDLHEPMQVLHADGALRITARGPRFSAGGPQAGPLTVSFTGVGPDADTVKTEEFQRSATANGRSAVFVSDLSCSWYNADGVYETILRVLGPLASSAEDVVTIGNSMGGFGAMMFAGPLGARSAIAFGPQISVSPRIVPQESRWRQYIDRIPAIRFEDLNDHLAEGVDYAVLHGSGGKDAFHIAALRPRPGLRHYLIEGGRHNVAIDLKARGHLEPLIAAAMAGDWAAFDRAARLAGGSLRGEVADVMADLEARRAERRARRKAAKRATKNAEA